MGDQPHDLRRAGEPDRERPGGTGASFPLSQPGFRSRGVRLTWLVAVVVGATLAALVLARLIA